MTKLIKRLNLSKVGLKTILTITICSIYTPVVFSQPLESGGGKAIYMWKDKNGVINYSQTPPSQKENTINFKTGNSDEAISKKYSSRPIAPKMEKKDPFSTNDPNIPLDTINTSNIPVFSIDYEQKIPTHTFLITSEKMTSKPKSTIEKAVIKENQKIQAVTSASGIINNSVNISNQNSNPDINTVQTPQVVPQSDVKEEDLMQKEKMSNSRELEIAKRCEEGRSRMEAIKKNSNLGKTVGDQKIPFTVEEKDKMYKQAQDMVNKYCVNK